MKSELALLALFTLFGSVVAVLSADAAEAVPVLAVEQSCRSVAAIDPQKIVTAERCLAQEKSARDELTTKWSSFDSADQRRCLDETRSGGSPSYVELLECVAMARDARALEGRGSGPARR